MFEIIIGGSTQPNITFMYKQIHNLPDDKRNSCVIIGTLLHMFILEKEKFNTYDVIELETNSITQNQFERKHIPSNVYRLIVFLGNKLHLFTSDQITDSSIKEHTFERISTTTDSLDITLRGTSDVINLLDDGVSAQIIDYKTSSQSHYSPYDYTQQILHYSYMLFNEYKNIQYIYPIINRLYYKQFDYNINIIKYPIIDRETSIKHMAKRLESFESIYKLITEEDINKETKYGTIDLAEFSSEWYEE